ncbi:MAG: Hsp33 family molecular chaperone [Alphaproteobacteria bacterium]|nr:Hsp33 family molecular chaperone [Alphaproteobacteria bacterium]
MDDQVIPFAIKPLGVRGRIVRLGAVLDDIISRHDYPDAVSALVAESVSLTAMLGTALKFNGKFIVQTKTSGPVNMIVADFVGPGGVRGCAKYSDTKLKELTKPDQKQLLGEGYLAMTVDQGADMERYQGIVPLGQSTLVDAAHVYFEQSEQIPTRLRVAAGPLFERGLKKPHWRAGAILVQHLPSEGGSSPLPSHSGDAPQGAEDEVQEDDNWVKARLLLDTVEDIELLDPALTAEDILYRLYHEDGVTVYPAIPIARHCTCSHEAVSVMLRNFSSADRADMVKDGTIEVVCEFCSTPYQFTLADFEGPAAA